MKDLLFRVNLNKIYIILVALISLFIIGSYFSYAMFKVTKEKNNAIKIITGNLTYRLEVDGKEGNTLNIPSNSSREFIIKLSNPNNIKARFNFYYLNNIPSNVEVGYILDCETNTLPSSTGINLEKVDTAGSTNLYKIMVENSSSNEINIALGVKVGLDYNDLEIPSNGHIFNEYINEPNPPELDDNMIAVTYNENNWLKADTSNTNNDWYNYNEQKWANAVTVSSSTRSKYKSANVGTVINIDDIETQWVWIPRYSYTIGSADGVNYYGKKGCYLENAPTLELPGEIDIRFVSTNIKDRGTAKYITTNGSREYYTPNGFTFNNKEQAGLWVAKFETSSSNPSASYGGGDTTSLDVMIKPNVPSWRWITLSNAFTVSLKMNDSGNRYGFTSNIDTHVMKNTEWAVVAYLSQSKYGKLGNINFKGTNKEVYQNKSNEKITGCSYGKPPNNDTDYGCHYQYNEEINGTGASTTGTIYGIYDMSGGAWEYVMATYNNLVGDSGFDVPPASQYYNKYTDTNLSTACNKEECISHALSETNYWYKDSHGMVTEEKPWLVRGGAAGSPDAGIFYFYAPINKGWASDAGSFRITIALNP